MFTMTQSDPQAKFRVTRRSLLVRSLGLGGVLLLAEACRGEGAPAYGGGAQQATQAPAVVSQAGSSTAAPQPAAAGTPKRGGMLISAVTAEPPTLDPHRGFPSTWPALMYDDLVYFDAQNQVQPNLAESWEVQSLEDLRIQFHHRRARHVATLPLDRKPPVVSLTLRSRHKHSSLTE